MKNTGEYTRPMPCPFLAILNRLNQYLSKAAGLLAIKVVPFLPFPLLHHRVHYLR
nr:hypothetical protein Q903MT_gene1783 [Picea sitchensis]